MMKARVQTALMHRRNFKDSFRDQNGYSWDYVIVFKVYDDDEIPNVEQIKYNMRYILSQLALGGLEVRLFYSLHVSKTTSLIFPHFFSFFLFSEKRGVLQDPSPSCSPATRGR